MCSECHSIKSNSRTEFSTINNIGMHIYSIFRFGLVLENKRAKKSSERASFVSSRWFRSWQWRPFRLRNAAQKQILNTTINIWRSEYVGDTTGRGGRFRMHMEQEQAHTSSLAPNRFQKSPWDWKWGKKYTTINRIALSLTGGIGADAHQAFCAFKAAKTRGLCHVLALMVIFL